MKIIYWSDYACPFCYIGERILKQAFKNLDTDEKLELVMKSFELDPSASKKVVSSTPERFANKYGLTFERALNRIEAISEMGKSAGIDFKYASTKYTNTLDAHRLTKLAQSKNDFELAEKLSENLFDAYFTKNLELANNDVLIDAGVKAGLDENEIKNLLSSDKYEPEVRLDEREAMEKGIHSVPFFIVSGKYYISGAQSLENMTETLKRGLNTQAMSCGIEGCSL